MPSVAGLFDEYLKEQPDLGSDLMTNAQLQYRTVVALQNRKVSLIWMKLDLSATLEWQPISLLILKLSYLLRNVLNNVRILPQEC